MPASKADIISRLQKEILPLQGYKPLRPDAAIDMGLGPVNMAFPQGNFPLGAVHEFCCAAVEDGAATVGFISVIIASLMQAGGAIVWISASRTIYPPALRAFGIAAERIVFVDLKKEKNIQWAMEEALKCDGLAAVIGEMQELDFTASRRLQLAVEKSRVTGFILRRSARNLMTTACLTRWKITQLPSSLPADMPGIGLPRWNVELLKIRNGKPGSWQVECKAGSLKQILKMTVLPALQKKAV